MIICIGSVNLDIFVDAHSSEFGIDRRGKFILSIGGTALNVASALKALGIDVTIVTALKRDSLFSSIMIGKLQNIGISANHIYMIDTSKESAFLAYRERGDLKLAINSTPVESVTIEGLPNLEGVRAIFLDFNNSTATIRNIVWQAYRKNIPVYTNLVSESKAVKLLSCPVNYFTVIAGNRYEIKAVLKNSSLRSINEISSRYPSPLWLVTADCDGASVWQAGQCLASVCPPQTEKVTSYSGAGDAFLAGFLCGMAVYGLGVYDSLAFANQVTASVLGKAHANLIDQAVLEGVADLFYRDKLTGLYTRKAMDIIQLPRQYSVIALDIDHFKQVNDTWGHDAGDDILRGFGRIIKSCIRKGDYAIRWGGEEFVVIVSVADSEVVSSIAERIRATTENTHFHIHHGGRQIRITCSAGIAITNSTHERSFSDVLKEADTKLYRAKQEGRNRVVLLDIDTDHALV